MAEIVDLDRHRGPALVARRESADQERFRRSVLGHDPVLRLLRRGQEDTAVTLDVQEVDPGLPDVVAPAAGDGRSLEARITECLPLAGIRPADDSIGSGR